MDARRCFQFGRSNVVVFISQLFFVEVAHLRVEDRVHLDNQTDLGGIERGDVVLVEADNLFQLGGDDAPIGQWTVVDEINEMRTPGIKGATDRPVSPD